MVFAETELKPYKFVSVSVSYSSSHSTSSIVAFVEFSNREEYFFAIFVSFNVTDRRYSRTIGTYIWHQKQRGNRRPWSSAELTTTRANRSIRHCGGDGRSKGRARNHEDGKISNISSTQWVQDKKRPSGRQCPSSTGAENPEETARDRERRQEVVVASRGLNGRC